jgi:hypothetical protein
LLLAVYFSLHRRASLLPWRLTSIAFKKKIV